MPFGFSTGQLLGLARDARAQEPARALVVAGPGALALATALAEHGDARAIAVDGDPARAAAVIWMLDGAPTAADVDALRRLARAGVPVIAVQSGPAARIPYVLPHDVLDAPGGVVPVDRVARALAEALPPAVAAALAARLPVLREPVERRIVHRTALVNAGIGAAPWVKQAHMPLMTLAQGRMLLELGVAAGAASPREAPPLAATAAPALAGSMGTGLGLRALHRRLPFRGRLAGAALAYAGTRVLGELRARI
jgi:hypothetical protein